MKQKEKEREEVIDPEEEPGTILIPEPEKEPEKIGDKGGLQDTDPRDKARRGSEVLPGA